MEDPASTPQHREPVLACPHCALALQLSATGADCGGGHHVDRAREGYFNLLVAGRITSTTSPGDTPEALEARRRFLGAGWYEPIARAVAELVDGASATATGPVLDVGCGEGYYLSHIASPERFGLDIAKAAVRMASRLLPDAQFVVGSAYRLPVLDESVAAVMSVFAPHPFDEFTRVLRTGGRWVTVTPGPGHLRELRPALAGDAAAKVNDRLERRESPPEEADSSTRLQFRLDLPASAAAELLAMTPLRWQSGAQQPDVADTDHDLTVTVDVWVSSATKR